MVKISRSKIDLFMDCRRCFWLDINKKIKRPPPAPYTINSSIDALLKQEFDSFRRIGQPHYIMKQYNINALPYNCQQINTWRDNFTGIQFQHAQSGFLVFGAIDDVWINPDNELIVVDFKATGAKEYRIYDSYKRQMEVYQWLFVKNGYKVSKTGYFVFAKVDKNKGFAGGKLSFDLFIEPQEGDYSWVDNALLDAKKTLADKIPLPNQNCPYCKFAKNWQ